MNRRRGLLPAALAVLAALAVGISLLILAESGNAMKKNIAKALREQKAQGSFMARGQEALGGQIEKLAGKLGFRGAVLAAQGDEILYAGAFDDADENGTPNALDTVFAVGSVSKQFTAAAVLQLASEGKLSLTDPITDYYPEYTGGKGITLKHLLNMCSGVGRDFWSMALALGELSNIAQADLFQLQKHSETELLDLICRSPLEFAPGERYMYSNVNYWLLAGVVTKASGMSYQEYVQKQLFSPCGMDGAFLDFEGTMAFGHNASGRTRENAILYEGAGTVCASILDLFRWSRALHGGSVLSESAYRVMTAPAQEHYAMGLVAEDDGLLWHNGQLNGYNAYQCYAPAEGITLILLSNSRVYRFHGEVKDFPAEDMAPILLKYVRQALQQ